jgi:hypothetical protein
MQWQSIVLPIESSPPKETFNNVYRRTPAELELVMSTARNSELVTGRAARVLIASAAVIFAVSIGSISALSPLGALGVVAAASVVAMVALGPRLPGFFLVVLGVSLIGYAFFGRAFAHLGFPPLFLSELMLGIGVIAIVVNAQLIRFNVVNALIVLFMTWGAVQTIPYVATYGIDALRDAVIWGYSLFALAVSFFFQRRHFDIIAEWYRRLIPYFLLWAPMIIIIPAVIGDLPTMPMTNVPILVTKAGDVAVHLTGIAGFVIAGLYVRRGELRIGAEMVMWCFWIIAVGLAGSTNRGGLLAIMLGVATALVLRPGRHVLTFAFAATLLIVTLAAVDPVVDLDRHRQLSVDQLVDNVTSIFGTDDRAGGAVLEGTRQWRLQWWGDIVDYTFSGPYFWLGKGFGINLADSDGYQTFSPDQGVAPLRSPHNGHLTILARSGVPGFAFWVLLQGTFGLLLLRSIIRARRRNQTFWVQLNSWILIYWIAAMINASFDVYLEGPQGGIWTWAMIGLGIAAMRFQQEDEVKMQLEQIEEGGNQRESTFFPRASVANEWVVR